MALDEAMGLKRSAGDAAVKERKVRVRDGAEADEGEEQGGRKLGSSRMAERG